MSRKAITQVDLREVPAYSILEAAAWLPLPKVRKAVEFLRRRFSSSRPLISRQGTFSKLLWGTHSPVRIFVCLS